jgi:RNA polymerase sigma-70 factor (ECF subfamily)
MPFQPPAPAEGRPDRIAENRELARVLEKALGRIEPDSRWLLLLSDVEGFTYEEIAAMAEIPVGTVKSRLHRARMALRKILAPVV